MASSTFLLFVTMLPKHVLSERVCLLKGYKALHAHEILVMPSTVRMERLLVLLRLETDFTGIVFFPDVSLKFQKA